MKRLFLSCISCFLPFITIAQSGFGDSVLISALPFQITKVITADIDNDGDNDVVISGQNANSIAWYKNLDGEGTFGSVQYITQALTFTQSLSIADLDGDGDLDVLATSSSDNKVVWYKNLDGEGAFSSEIIIATGVLNPKQAIASDIDGLIGKDVIIALRDENRIIWYRNLNGMGSFINQQNVSVEPTGVFTIDAIDIDGDGDNDIISNSPNNYSLYWYKNNGLGIFETHFITNDTFGASLVTGKDIDGDGDNDLVIFEAGGDKISWFENLDGLGSFSIKKVIANIYRPSDIFVSDIDNDGDLDILTTFVGDGKIAWFKNLDGAGTFSNRIIIDDYASSSIVGADIDGDGYKDVVTANNGLYDLVWYKNLTYLGIEDQLLQALSIYPNPATNVLQINNPNNVVIKQVKVYNVLGEEVLQVQGNNETINVSNLHPGVYLVKLITQEGVRSIKVVKE